MPSKISMVVLKLLLYLIIGLLFLACGSRKAQVSINVISSENSVVLRKDSIWSHEFFRTGIFTELDYCIDSLTEKLYVNDFDRILYSINISNGAIIDSFPLYGLKLGKRQKFNLDKYGSNIFFSSQRNFLIFSLDLKLKKDVLTPILEQIEYLEYADSLAWSYALDGDTIYVKMKYKEYEETQRDSSVFAIPLPFND